MKAFRLKPKPAVKPNPLFQTNKTWSSADDTLLDAQKKRSAMKASFSKYWDEPVKERRSVSRGETAAVGTAAGLGLGAGAVYLATRGKAKPKVKIKTVERIIDNTPKIPKWVKEKNPPYKKGDPTASTGKSLDEIRAYTDGEAARVHQRSWLMSRAKLAEARNNQMAADAARRKAAGNPDPLPGKFAPQGPMSHKQSEALEAENIAIRAQQGVPADTATGPVPQRPSKRKSRRARGKEEFGKGDFQILAKRAYQDKQDEIFKATLTGEQGDKRNTKYAVAAGAGFVAGTNIGTHVGAKNAGTTYKANREKNQQLVKEHIANKKAKIAAQNEANQAAYRQARKGNRFSKVPKPEYVSTESYKPKFSTLVRINNSVKGTKSIHWGGRIGAVAGIAAGAGSMAAYRNRKPKTVMI